MHFFLFYAGGACLGGRQIICFPPKLKVRRRLILNGGWDVKHLSLRTFLQEPQRKLVVVQRWNKNRTP